VEAVGDGERGGGEEGGRRRGHGYLGFGGGRGGFGAACQAWVVVPWRNGSGGGGRGGDGWRGEKREGEGGGGGGGATREAWWMSPSDMEAADWVEGRRWDPDGGEATAWKVSRPLVVNRLILQGL
jgi:hypothetical protein